MWEERPGTGDAVRLVWHARVDEPGRYPLTGSEYWGISFIRRPDGSLAGELDGPTLAAHEVDSIAGEEYWGLEHRGWERFGQDASARRRTYVGPGAWGAVLEHFADVTEPPSDPADLDALREAYDAFYSEASAGGFGPAPDGEWDALQTIAHVTLNDYAMAAVMQSIIHARPITFANTVCQDRAVLARHIDRFAADPASLVAQGRAAAATVIALLGRLSPAQRETLVHCHLLHDGEVVLDAEMPWSQIAIDAQAGRHLPAHIGQLRDLRESEAQGSDAQDSDAR